MSDDIVIDLRNRAKHCKEDLEQDVEAFVLRQAADEIERLRADRDHWRKVADVCIMAIGVPENDIDRLAVRHYDEAMRNG